MTNKVGFKYFFTNQVRLSVVIIAATLIILTNGCGKRGNPKPPEAFAPKAVVGLVAAGEVDAVVLNWSAPESTADGEDLESLTRFVIKRSDYDPEKTPRFKEIGEVPYQEKLEQESLELVKYSFRDNTVEVGKRYEYNVLAVGRRDIEGMPGVTLRVTFRGESSLVQAR